MMMKQHLIKNLLLALFILPTVCLAQQQVDSNQVAIRAFYSSYAVISDFNDFDKYLNEFKSLLDKYASVSFKKTVIDELEDPNSTAEDIVTGNRGINSSSLSDFKIEKKTPSLYLVRYPIYDSDEKKYIEIGLKITLDSHGKIQSVAGSYTKEINNPTDLNK